MTQSLFEARPSTQIPPLAWLFDVSPSHDRPVLRHGTSVAVFRSGFSEGAWDGEFSAAAFDRSRNVFGSGAKVDGDTVTFVTPSHTLEPLVAFSGDGLSAVSNSLAFLFAYCGLDLTRVDWRSGERFAAIIRGIVRSPTTVQLRTGQLSIVHHHNFMIRAGAIVGVVPKDLPPRFDGFDDYYDYLTETVRAVSANASDKARARRYSPLATLSSGYDSAVGATVATLVAGCKDAISLKTSQQGEPDTGASVAAALGLSLREYTRPNRTGDAASFAEFLSAGMQGEDYVFTAFGSDLTGRLLFTGVHGDTLWGIDSPPHDEIRKGDLGGCSLGEFRLLRDFLHLPVPFIGCQRHTDIHRISNSPEMSPYSVGGTYDRPIPRRIVESAGVPRQAFGQRKRATNLIAYRKPALLSRATLSDIERFRRTLDIPFWDEIRSTALSARWHTGMALFHTFDRLRRLRGSRIRAVAIPRAIGRRCHAALSRVLGPYAIFEHAHPKHDVWQRWAIARMKERYAAVQRGRTGQDGASATLRLVSSDASVDRYAWRTRCKMPWTDDQAIKDSAAP